jgi:hypothetical protein
MTLVMGLKYLGVTVIIMFGVWGLIQPKKVKGFTGLEPATPKGEIEIRSVLGGTLIGLGIAALVFPMPQVFKTLSIAFITITVVRGIMMVVDKSIDRPNLISLFAGGILAAIFFL